MHVLRLRPLNSPVHKFLLKFLQPYKMQVNGICSECQTSKTWTNPELQFVNHVLMASPLIHRSTNRLIIDHRGKLIVAVCAQLELRQLPEFQL